MYLEELNAERKLKKAIVNLQKKLPFIGYLGLRLKINKLDDENKQCQTMGVDGMFNIYYNENFVNNVVPNFEVLTGIMAHEILHIALNHLTRVKSRKIRD
jgi:predicted metal-dependent peptidase